VAALRDNGWLQLWCCTGSHWAVTSTFIVGAPSGIRCVLFMPSLFGGDNMDRLFTADLSGNIVEWDVLTQSPCAHTLSFGGSVWALAAVPACADTIAVACQDGGTRLFSIAQPQSIILNKVIVRHSSPCVCVAAASTGSLLVTGYEDGSCRVVDVLGVAAPVTFRTVPSGDQVKHPRVWAVAFCGEQCHSVAAADANGSVHVFDLSSGTLQQSRHISNNGDMLCLISDGCGGLLSASVNAKVFHITCAHGVSAGSPWRVSSACRLHTHDVYSLALFSKTTLLSGGLDCQLAVYSLESGARSLRAVRKVMPLPRHGSVSSSTSGRHNVLAQISGSGILDLFRGDIGVGSDDALELQDAGAGLGFELAVRVEPPKVTSHLASSTACSLCVFPFVLNPRRIPRGSCWHCLVTVNSWL
jgi:WD40 repeat protein